MAEIFGTRLLNESGSEDLNELLSSLVGSLPVDRNPAVPHIPLLKQLLSKSVSNGSEGFQMTQDNIPGSERLQIPSSPTSTSSPRELVIHESRKLTLKKLPLIELVSTTANSKRTHLLSYFLGSLLLPDPPNPTQIVVYFDCACKFSYNQIHTHLQAISHDAVAVEALSRLHIIRPSSSRDLLDVLRKLETYLFSLSDSNVTLAAVIIADLSVYYWSERWAEEEARFVGAGGATDKVHSRDSLHAMIVEEVGKLQRLLHCIVIVSGLGVISSTSDAGGESVRSGLASSWSRVVDLRIVLSCTIDGTSQAEFDARKWLNSCGDRTSKGTGKLSIRHDAGHVQLIEVEFDD